MGLLFFPIWFWRDYLYRWMDVPRGVDPLLDAKRAYLNWEFFLFRAIFFFVALTIVAYLLRRFSVRQDRDGNPQFTIWMRKAAFVGLPLFALCLTFGAFDWLMSLNWHWFSTMWGPYIFAGTAGSSMSLLILVTAALQRAGYLKGVVTVEHYHIMGKWLLAFTVFWAYIGFSQYMLYWYANIPEETQYFLVRNTESWNVLSWFLVIFRFFVPFALLLPRYDEKESHLALLHRRLDPLHAVARHVYHRPARAARHRRSSQHSRFSAAHRESAAHLPLSISASWARPRFSRCVTRA